MLIVFHDWTNEKAWLSSEAIFLELDLSLIYPYIVYVSSEWML